MPNARGAAASIATLICALVLSSCGGAGGGGEVQPSPATASPASPTATKVGEVDGLFDVGGHRLHLRCTGSGSPTVVYLHGYIHDAGGGGSQNSGAIPNLLNKERQVCIYDRANVGSSDAVPGPITGEDSVRDLHALMRAAGIPGPYVLLGASWGGTIALMYAATHRDDVAGMVVLDPALPSGNELDKRFVPPKDQLGRDDWRESLEQVDQYESCEQALRILKGKQNIPVTMIIPKKPDLDPSWPVKEMSSAIRNDQKELMQRFSPGKIVTLDVPHYMEPAAPDRIAAEVEEVLEAGKQ